MLPLVGQIPPDSSVSRKSTRGAASSTDYRPYRGRIPTLGVDFYRFRGERIPTLRGDFTDRSGADYRPYWEIWRIKPLQKVALGLTLSVYMMLCLCLVFCLVNREVTGG